MNPTDYNQYISKKILIGNQYFANTKHILLCGDCYYLKYVGVTLTSIILSNPNANLNFHIICDDVQQTDLDKFKAVNKQYDCGINLYVLDTDLIKDLSRTVNTDSHVNVAGLFRLIGFCILPKDVDKILYMDSDILVTGKIDAFYETDINDNVAIVIKDLESEMHQKETGVNNYFNSGVMFINIKKWNELNLIEESLKLMFSGKKYRFVDQDVLNIVLQNKTMLFSDNFNYMYRLNYTAGDEKFNDNAPVIWHFIGISKPWHEWTQEFEIVKRYNDIVKMSFWSDNKIIKLSDIKNLKIKYKVYKIISRGCKNKGNIWGWFKNTLKYCILKLKYNLIN